MDSEQLMELITTYAIRVIGAIAILVIGLLVARWVKRLVIRSTEKANVDKTLGLFLARGASIFVVAFTVMAVLGRFGIETASFIAVLGAAGLAVGLAMQGTLSNFAAGVMLILFRPFKQGDFVEAGGESGTVESIDLFSTRLDTIDNKRVIIANSEIYGSTITNVTFHPMRRMSVNVGTDYGADLSRVRSILEAVPPKIDGVLADPAPQIFLDSLGDSSINWQVRAWANASDYWNVKQLLTQEVKAALDAADVGIPYPQMDVHMDGSLQRN